MPKGRMFEPDDPALPVTPALRQRLSDSGMVLAGGGNAPSQSDATPKPRAFTAADKALIRKLHGFMPPSQLLGVLNDRLVADLGQKAVRYTVEHLHAEIGEVASTAPDGGHDFAALRKIIAAARRDGTLADITEQVIDDFAVVFSLNTRQVLRLKDIILPAKESD